MCTLSIEENEWKLYSHLVITEYWIGFPVLYNRSLLVACLMCGSMYVSFPVSQFIPSLSSPLPTNMFVLYTCDYFCFVNKCIGTIFVDSSYTWHHDICLPLSDWLYSIWHCVFWLEHSCLCLNWLLIGMYWLPFCWLWFFL